MQGQRVENIVVDEANGRTYVILAPRVLSDGEIYRAIRLEILRRGRIPLARGETLTLTVTSSGSTLSSAAVDGPQTGLPRSAAPDLDQKEALANPPPQSGKS